MASKMKSTFTTMLITLVVISSVAALALGAVYNATKGPIALAQAEKQKNAIKVVLPPFTDLETVLVPDADGSDSIECFIGTKDGKVVGVAINTYTMNGFSGLIRLMVGFTPNDEIYKTSVLFQAETPGLGDKMDVAKSDFPVQFWEKNAASLLTKGKFLVTKDGGKIDAITAATISSRAFCDAVQRGYDTFEKQKINLIGGNK